MVGVLEEEWYCFGVDELEHKEEEEVGGEEVKSEKETPQVYL